MTQFFFEYFLYISITLAILVSSSTAILFFLTQSAGETLRSFWRLLGFTSITIGFAFLILVQKNNDFELAWLFFELVGFVSIFIGVRLEPSLEKLLSASHVSSYKNVKEEVLKTTLKNNIQFILIIFSLGILTGLFTFFHDDITEFENIGENIKTFIALLSAAFIFFTVILQTQRFFSERKQSINKLQNLFPIISFVLLFFRSIGIAILELPQSDVVFIENARDPEGNVWKATIFLTIFAFIFLGIWAWNFIKPRFELRLYVIFIGIISSVASLGALIFTLLIFQIVERDNLKIMSEATQAQLLVMEDRSTTALTLARSIARNSDLPTRIQTNDYDTLIAEAEDQFDFSGIDVIRIYDAEGLVLASADDPRETLVDSFADDELLQEVLQTNSALKSFGTESHILSPILLARGIYPVVSGDTTIGAVEVTYKLDTAFVDFSKDRTGLDVTIYTDDDRSATTIFRDDNASRWVGTEETNEDVLQEVLEDGNTYTLRTDRLGEEYYSAFSPIRDYNGEIIGMVSVGTPTVILFDDSIDQLWTAFVIMSVISVFAAIAGYYLSATPLSIVLSRMTSQSLYSSSAGQKIAARREHEEMVQKIKEEVQKEKAEKNEKNS